MTPSLKRCLCSVRYDSSNTSDTTSAKWYETLATRSLVTVDPSVSVVRAEKTPHRRVRGIQVATSRSEQKIIAADGRKMKRVTEEKNGRDGKQEAVEMCQFCWPRLHRQKKDRCKQVF